MRLAIAIGALTGVLVGIGWLGLNQIDQIQVYVDENVNRRWAKALLSREALRDVNRNDLITFQITLYTEASIFTLNGGETFGEPTPPSCGGRSLYQHDLRRSEARIPFSERYFATVLLAIVIPSAFNNSTI